MCAFMSVSVIINLATDSSKTLSKIHAANHTIASPSIYLYIYIYIYTLTHTRTRIPIRTCVTTRILEQYTHTLSADYQFEHQAKAWLRICIGVHPIIMCDSTAVLQLVILLKYLTNSIVEEIIFLDVKNPRIYFFRFSSKVERFRSELYAFYEQWNSHLWQF